MSESELVSSKVYVGTSFILVYPTYESLAQIGFHQDQAQKLVESGQWIAPGEHVVFVGKKDTCTRLISERGIVGWINTNFLKFVELK